jgi:hypothetical protein
MAQELHSRFLIVISYTYCCHLSTFLQLKTFLKMSLEIHCVSVKEFPNSTLTKFITGEDSIAFSHDRSYKFYTGILQRLSRL